LTTIHGFELPDHLYYLIEKHVWVAPRGGGLARLGMTSVGYHLLRDTLVAISVQAKVLGIAVPKGKSIAMVESLKYIGPLPAPFAGVVERVNEMVQVEPDLAAADPYGTGWIAELRTADWESAAAGLLTGEAAMIAYQALLRAQNIHKE
jgi:glycine cleavage system H protein